MTFDTKQSTFSHVGKGWIDECDINAIAFNSESNTAWFNWYTVLWETESHFDLFWGVDGRYGNCVQRTSETDVPAAERKRGRIPRMGKKRTKSGRARPRVQWSGRISCMQFDCERRDEMVKETAAWSRRILRVQHVAVSFGINDKHTAITFTPTSPWHLDFPGRARQCDGRKNWICKTHNLTSLIHNRFSLPVYPGIDLYGFSNFLAAENTRLQSSSLLLKLFLCLTSGRVHTIYREAEIDRCRTVR